MNTIFTFRPVKIFIVIFLLNSIFLSQLFYDSWRLAYAREPEQPINVLIEPHPLPAETLKKVSFGMNNLVSDVLWLQTIQYYGSGNPSGRYRRLAQMLDEVTQMDEKFTYPYIFALLILPGEGFTKEAVALGERAVKNPDLKNSWEIPYYLGLTYHVQLKNHERAAQLFVEASKRPGALEITRFLAGKYYANADKPDTALALYYVAYKTASNKYIKENAKKNIDHLELIFSLQDAVKVYHKKFKHYPSNLQELVDKKIIKNIPADPLKSVISVDPKTGQVSSSIK